MDSAYFLGILCTAHDFRAYPALCQEEKRYILNESTFWNGRYMDYLDENYEDNVNPKKTIHEDNGWLEDF